MCKKLNWFQRWIDIPPLEQRPCPAPWINKWAVAGYDPNIVETYILLRVFFLSALLNAIMMAVYAIPLVFNVDVPALGLTTVRPVEHFMVQYPKEIWPWTLLACLLYLIFLLFRHRSLHRYDFASHNKIFSLNLENMIKKSFWKYKLIFLMIFVLVSVFFTCFFVGYAIEFFGSYLVVENLYDYDVQNIDNFLVIYIFYIVFLGGVSANYIYIFINFTQIICNRHPYIDYLKKQAAQ